ncbi:MAG: hypothetical protein OEN01_05370 [Candidatus Krumholzibacteria bacterium]|nr:hypothetical protein [Candidatus Krumholzibacteria bacterium]
MAIRLGLPRIPEPSSSVAGGLTEWRGHTYYRITGYDLMDPFLISVVSHSDLWMYASSRGGLAAGRRDSSHSLFPYETVDKLHASQTHTGPTTVVRCEQDENTYVWEPFSVDGRMRYEVERALYKHTLGCELWFEEHNLTLGLRFRYGWRPSSCFGWVRTCELENTAGRGLRVEVLDGVQNLLPAGVGQGLQDSASCLVDAYKSAECDPASGLALYRLTANIIDRAIASEALGTTVAWRSGFDNADTLLDGTCREDFIRGRGVSPDSEFNGRRGAYLLNGAFELGPDANKRWHMVFDSPVDHVGLARLRQRNPASTGAAIENDIREGHETLYRLLAGSDALQLTGDELASAHHISNVLYNVARGGTPSDHYQVERDDLANFLATRNRPVARRHAGWLRDLPERVPHMELLGRADAVGDPDLLRLCYEYLPLVFSRRHGDPSRPWNQFAIVMENPDGSTSYSYQGNWRDIYQNWEALARSYPELLEPMIAKFVNATTVDGFNPYRITRDGIDWEISDPNDPWSSIGYWGDHQIVYLLKLLEASIAHHPGRLNELLERDLFSYADVPYDIKPYPDVVADPQNTIDFNQSRQRNTEARVEQIGTDGRLVHDGGGVLLVNFAEKLLVPILSKMSNLVPGGGIWMNTMRPEWNDANNALVGNGVSVVTACYLYRHLGVCADLLDAGPPHVSVSAPVARWLQSIGVVIAAHSGATNDGRAGRAFMDDAGRAFSDYRSVYTDGMGERKDLETPRVVAVLRAARELIAETIRANRRDDGLYHAYNVLHLADDTASIGRLPLMLEGQVAALSSGLLAPSEAVSMLRALRASNLYSEDQHSYLLYPVKELPDFADKNRVPESILGDAPRLKQMLDDGDHSVVARDAAGQLRFHADLHNADALRQRLAGFPNAEVAAVLAAYESVFNHKSFTGRSGTMYGYEGIGCIYWHMVAKLLLAAQAVFETAQEAGEDGAVVEALRAHYYDIRAGLGFMKTPAEFGAFPLDPYSHTPGFAGAKQPGMTGQVKEAILARWGELGVYVDNGVITFNPVLLRDDEYLADDARFSYVDAGGKEQSLDLAAGSLAFTFCQVPIVYTRGGDASISVRYADGRHELIAGNSLAAEVSALVFARSAVVERVDVHVPA